MGDTKFLVTGASGCIGSWVLKNLEARGIAAVASDLSINKTRPGLLMSEETLEKIDWLALDVTDTAAVDAAVKAHGITHIVHLAGLQIPFAKANPPLGAEVNVGGTVNIFEAARNNGVKGLSYASSIAVFGPAEKYGPGRLADDAERLPDTLYGIYKTADEEMARVYAQDWSMGSVGLRPGVVYGVGRDQGLTSDISKALLAIAAGRPFHIRFDGLITLQHAGDAANIFIDCALAGAERAHLCNIRNDVISVADVVANILALYPDAKITHETGKPLPFPADLDDANLQALLGDVPHMPLQEAIERDVTLYRELVASDRIDLEQLDK